MLQERSDDKNTYYACQKNWTKNDAYKYHWAITISAHDKTKYIAKSSIDAVLTQLKQANTSLTFYVRAYENSGKYNQLHFHGLAKANKPINYRKYKSIDGFFIKYDLIRSNKQYKAAVRYCTKECYHQYSLDNIITENYFTKMETSLFDKLSDLASLNNQ